MAYIQITTRCNMKCKHCCGAHTTKGQDMTPEVFEKALELAVTTGHLVAIGGGEPTLHPDFWRFLIDAVAADLESPPWLATNGKNTTIAIKLAKMASVGIIACDLSRDKWHEEISPEVVKAFTKEKFLSRGEDLRGIRTVTKISNYGRARRNQVGTTDDCFCEDFVVKPDGRIYQCGCPGSKKLGTVFRIDEDLLTQERKCWRIKN